MSGKSQGRAVQSEQDAPEQKRAGGMTRRTFVIGTGSAVALLGLGSLRYMGSTPVVRPPGGQDENALIGKCVHCHRCVEACPYKLIVPSKIEYGIISMRTPRLEFSDNYPGQLDAMKFCDFCAQANDGVPLCAQLCPSGALDLNSAADAENVVLGVAEVDANLCLAYRGAHCTFCHDACVDARGADALAIHYRDFVKDADEGALLPVVDINKCNGCGACESVCVSVQAGSTRDAKTRAIVIKPMEA